MLTFTRNIILKCVCVFLPSYWMMSVHTVATIDQEAYEKLKETRQSEMADLARRATRWVGTLSDGNVHVKFHDDWLRNGGYITY